MVRISAILIAGCTVLIAGSGVLYLRFGFIAAEPVLAGLALLTALAVYNAVEARRHDATRRCCAAAATRPGSLSAASLTLWSSNLKSRWRPRRPACALAHKGFPVLLGS